jgi:Tol biopolymer transport system component/DNA-binding winged helix-turn-helix (wHTH) protein
VSNRQSGNEPEHSGPRPVVPGTRLKLGDFTLDLQKHALFRGMEKVHLTLKPLQVLEILIRRPGEVVSKNDLLKAVWRGEFVTDDVLVQAVGEIRRALQDDKDNPAFVQTVPREGYRFIAQVAVERPEGAREQPATIRPDLGVVGEGRSRRARIDNPPSPGRLKLRIVALVILAGSISAVYWWRFRPSGVDWSRPRLLAPIPGTPYSPSFSPDGSMIAYINVVDGVDQVFVRRLGQESPVQLTSGDTPIASARWCPKDEQILFSRGTRGLVLGPAQGRQTIWSVAAQGGQPHKIIDNGRNPASSPDGSRIVFERGPDIWIADADGGNERRLEGVPSSENLLADRTPSFSPDGSRIAFFHTETGPKGDFWTIPAKGGQPTRLTFDVCRGSKPVWTRDGKELIFASERTGVSALWRVPISGGRPQLLFDATGDDGDPDISPDGRQLIFTNTRNRFILTLLDPAKGSSKELVEGRLKMVYPMFDPQGQRIALFMQERREGGGDALYTVDRSGMDLNPVTRNPSERNTFPHWSADGAYLYFYQTSPVRAFRRIRVEGGPSSEVVAGWTWYVNYGARVDSRQKSIVYSEEHDGVPVKTLVRDISTGQERVLAKALDDPRWSRDDRLIVGVDVTAAKPPEGRISICLADGGACREVTTGYRPVWSAENGSIYFLRTGALHDGAELWITGASGSPERKLAELRPMSSIAHFYDVSPRGEVVFVQFKPGNRELWLAERPVFASRR